MAIKTISQLQQFDNGTGQSSENTGPYGGNMHSITNCNRKDNYRTDADTIITNDLTPNQSLIKNNKSCYPLDLSSNEDGFHQCLFEVSVPADKGIDGVQTSEEVYESKCFTYADLAKNLILDTKQYLNYRNSLDDFNIRAIVFDTYEFTGSKFISGDVCIDLKSNSFETQVGSTYTPMNKLRTVNGGVLFDKGNSTGQTLSTNLPTYIDSSLDVINKGTFHNNIEVYKNAYIHDNISATNLELTGTGKIITTNLTSTSDTFTLFHNNKKGSATIYGTLSVTDSISTSKLSCDSADITGRMKSGSVETGKLTCTQLSCNGSAQITGNTDIWGTLTVGQSGNGTIKAGECDLTASHARWSDLAEYYIADKQYEPGTLMKFGGSNEVTIADDEVNAVVTTKPGYVMNSELIQNPLGCPLALCGRVPVKIIGKVKKFDKIILSEINGVAKVKNGEDRQVIGISLVDKNDEEIGLVECVVKLSF